jgi:serine/threonine protein kinase
MDVTRRIPADPPHEEIAPVIHNAIDEPLIWVIPLGGNQPELRRVFVSRLSGRAETGDDVDVHLAYQIFPPEAFQPIELRHGGPVWGYVYKGFIITRGADMHFRDPAEHEARIVAIKCLDRAVVDAELANGSRENPYREIYRMQTIGDNHHVLGIIEALQSKRYLYICTPWANIGSLSNISLVPTSRPPPRLQPEIPRELPVEEERVRRIFRQMMEGLEYLHDTCGICHRDIKPANFLVNNDGRVLLADLAMSFMIPPSGIVNHIGHFGTVPYWVPEILAGLPFDARGCDLWACMITLFTLVTGLPVLYRLPHFNDPMFLFAIMAGGLSRNMHNPLVQQVVDEATDDGLTLINEAAIRITNLTDELLDMFENTLRLDPNARWTRQDVLECEWMNAPP